MTSFEDLDAVDEAVFGPVAGRSEAGGLVALFEEAGLCAESAQEAAVGMRTGEYLSFEDAALAQTVFDPDRRNVRATPQRIIETARKAAAGGGETVAESGSGTVDEVSEAALDALDDAVFGTPGKRQVWRS